MAYANALNHNVQGFIVSKLILVDETELYLLLGEYCLPTDDTDCAPVAEELVRRVEAMTFTLPPPNWI